MQCIMINKHANGTVQNVKLNRVTRVVYIEYDCCQTTQGYLILNVVLGHRIAPAVE